MSHARGPLILDEDIRKSYYTKHHNKQGKRRISSSSGSGSGSTSSSCNENHKITTTSSRDCPAKRPPAFSVLQEPLTGRIVSPDFPNRSKQPFIVPLNDEVVWDEIRKDTVRQVKKTTSRQKPPSAVTPTVEEGLVWNERRLCVDQGISAVDPHLKEHHLWDEYGFQRFHGSYSSSLDDTSTVGTSTSLSRRNLLKHDPFGNSSFFAREESNHLKTNRSDSIKRQNAFSISKLIKMKNRHNNRKEKNGRKIDSNVIVQHDCDVGSAKFMVEDDPFDFSSDNAGSSGQQQVQPVPLINLNNKVIKNIESLREKESDVGRFHEMTAMDDTNGSSPPYAFDVQKYGEKVRKYDMMRMVGKYRLAYESMVLDEITGDWNPYYTATTNSDLPGVGNDERLLDSVISRQSLGKGPKLDAVDISSLSETLDDRPCSLDDKAGVLDRYNSHDEMSPLVTRSKTIESRWRESNNHDHDHSHDTPTRSKAVYSSAKETKETGSSSPSRATHKLPLVKETSHDEMSPYVQKKVVNDNADAIIINNYSMNKYESKNAYVSIEACKVHPLEKEEEAKEPLHVTPRKTINKKRSGGPFLDNSWQPSPIQPEGSFAIFNDSQAVTLQEYESLAITSSKAVQTSPNSIQIDNEIVSTQQEFLKIVAAIVIQTFFRRHLAYKLAWNRYTAVLKIQRFLGRTLERKKFQQAIMKRTTFQFYDLAAIQIQAAWRGWWVRDCLNVETYCACMIQKVFRSHMAQRQYKYDLHRIVVAQSVIRRFLTAVAIEKQTKAATLIQTNWRKSVAKSRYINTLVDVLIVQSVCRRFLVLKRIARFKKRNTTLRQSQKRIGGIISSKNNYHVSKGHLDRATVKTSSRPIVREVDAELNQLNADELIRKWESRRR
jgi:chorismate mutase